MENQRPDDPAQINFRKESQNNNEALKEVEFIYALEKSKLDTSNKRNVLLTKIGAKPASFINMPIQLRKIETGETTEYFKEEEIKEIKKLIEDSGLEHSIKITTKAGNYRKSLESEYFKGEYKSIEILIGSTEENLESLKKAMKNRKGEALGLAIGFPKTAVEAFAKIKGELFFDLPGEIIKQDFMAFKGFTFSKDNWQEELETVKKWAEDIKKYAPNIYKESVKKYQERIAQKT